MEPVPPRTLSISTCFDYTLPISQQIPLIAEAGFTALSLSGKEEHSGILSKTGRSRLKELLQAYGLRLDTIHGPRADQPDSLNHLTAVAQAAAECAAPIVVMHGGPFDFGEEHLSERLETLLRTCEQLETVAERTGVRFALENVCPGPATELIRLALGRLNPQSFGFCYDSSHDQIGGPRSFDLLHALKDRVMAVHLSDRLQAFMDHVLPTEGFIDWMSLCAILRASYFAGSVLLEVMTTYSAEKDPQRFLALAHAQAQQLSLQIFGEDNG